MIEPEVTKNEKERLEELELYGIMDSEIEEDFDNLTKLAAEICGTKISLVSLLDDKRQWFKSRFGLDVSETAKELAFCGHAIHRPDQVFVVNDARNDERFFDNPLVTDKPHVIFYAGVPLVSSNGFPLGTLCVIDDDPKALTEKQIQALVILSRQVMNLIELRKYKRDLNEKNLMLERKNKEIEQFAYVAAHDLKSPLNNIKGVIDLIFSQESFKSDDASFMLDMVRKSSESLAHLIDQLLNFSKTDIILASDRSEIQPIDLIEELRSVVIPDPDCSINLITDLDKLEVNSTGTLLVLRNLVTNSIKYSDKAQTVVDIGVSEKEKEYEFYVKDNGPGIAPEYKEKVFEPFKILTGEDKYGNRGTGLGLANVKKVIDKMGGSISFESEMGIGTIFTFTIKKSIYANAGNHLIPS